MSKNNVTDIDKIKINKSDDGIASKTESKTITRKIFYYFSDGSKVLDVNGNHAIATQTAVFTRIIKKDPTTGNLLPEPWTEAVFKEMPIVPIKGYKPNILSVPEVTVTPDNPAANIDVYFTKAEDAFTGVKEVSGEWLFFRNGKVDRSFTGVALSSNGNWIFIKNGKYDISYTGVAKSTRGNWLYVNYGRWNATYRGIAKIINSDKKVYVSNGRWDQSFNGNYKGHKIKDGIVIS